MIKMWYQYNIPDLLLTMSLHVFIVTLSVLATILVLNWLKRMGVLVDDNAFYEEELCGVNERLGSPNGLSSSSVKYLPVPDDPLMSNTISIVENKC